MIKMLSECSLNYLLKVINRHWIQSRFPDRWSESIVISFPKPGKDPSKSSNYCPIALTSCLCKIVEQMINERLTDYLDMTNAFNEIQFGGRQHRSTTDHLVRLETEIRTAFALDQYYVSVFFDLEKSNDTTWRYGIRKDLHTCGLRGRLPLYIAGFLRRRVFNVRIANSTSETDEQVNGVLQGSVLNMTLFVLKINGIAKVIPRNQSILPSLYVDNLQIRCRHQNLSVIQTTMQ